MSHPEWREGIKARMDALLKALPDEPINPKRFELIKGFEAVYRNPYYDKQTTTGPPDWER